MSLFDNSVNIRKDLDVGILSTFDSSYRDARRSFLSCISNDGNRMFFAEIVGIEGKCIVYLVDLKSGRVVIEGQVEAFMVVCADYSHNDKTIVLACSTSTSSVLFEGATPGGKLILIDPETLNPKREIILGDAHRLDFGACKFHPDNESLIFVEVSHSKAMHTHIIGLLDINALAFVWTVSGTSVTSIPPIITFSRYYNCLIVKDSVEGFLKSIDAVSGDVISSCSLRAYHHFKGICVSHSGNIVAIKHLSFNCIWLLDAKSLELIRTVFPFDEVKHIVFTGDDKDILVWSNRVGTRDKIISRIDMSSGTVDSVVASPFETTSTISVLNDGSGRFVADLYRSIAIFYPRGVKSYTMSNAVVATASGIKRGLFLPVELWDLINNKFTV